MNQKLTLYHAHWSLCSQMVRVALYEKGLQFKSERIKLCDHSDEAGNLADDFLKNINPTAVVPVLKLNDEIIRDSAYIIERIDNLEGDNEINLWPQDPLKRRELKKWVEDTTITEGVGMGKSGGTMVPLFSTGLIEDLIKNLKFKNISFIIDRYIVSKSKVATESFTGDGSTASFVVDELIHEEDILVKEGSDIVFVGQGVTADNNIKPTYLTADGTLRSADHELGITLSHNTSTKKTTITFTKEVPSDGTIIKVERSNDKYLKFRDKGLING